MTGDLNVNYKRIFNLPLPNGLNQPVTKSYADLYYLHIDGSMGMAGNLSVNNKKITHLLAPTLDAGAENKKYVDDSKVDLSKYLKLDGISKLTGDLDVNNHRIKNLTDNPKRGTDAANKNYVNSKISHPHIQPSHQKNEFDYLMSNVLEWTDLSGGGNGFNLTKTADLSMGNFHSYNKKVIYTTIIKTSQGGYRYKMGIQCYRL